MSADLVIAEVRDRFHSADDSARLLAKVNTAALEYAAAISKDGLTLYFTRVGVPFGSSSPAIWVGSRRSTTGAFGTPTKLTALTGFVEAPALSPDGRALYFHKLVGKTFVIYRAPVR